MAERHKRVLQLICVVLLGYNTACLHSSVQRDTDSFFLYSLDSSRGFDRIPGESHRREDYSTVPFGFTVVIFAFFLVSHRIGLTPTMFFYSSLALLNLIVLVASATGSTLHQGVKLGPVLRVAGQSYDYFRFIELTLYTTLFLLPLAAGTYSLLSRNQPKEEQGKDPQSQ